MFIGSRHLGGIYSPDPSRIMKSYLDTLAYFLISVRHF